MSTADQRIAIVGAGVAGTRLASILADRGLEVWLFDHRAPWEKPCGGGLTPRAVSLLPELHRLGVEPREHKGIVMNFPSGRRVKLTLTWPLFLVSRARLGRALLEQSLRAGVHFFPEKVQRIRLEKEAVVLQTDGGEYEASLLVGADGVRSLVRQSVAGPLPRADLCLTYSTLIPGRASLPVILKFFPGVEGYAWIFPRGEETSAGIAMENGGLTPGSLRERLEEFIREEFELYRQELPPFPSPRGYYLPALRSASFAEAVLAGERWALVGDASGSCDPLTGEGISYALQTAQFLGQALSTNPPDSFKTYVNSWQTMITPNLARVSRWRSRFYQTRLLNFIAYCIDHSPAVRNLTRDLLAGVQEYSTLKERILSRWPKYAREVFYYSLTFQKGERRR